MPLTITPMLMSGGSGTRLWPVSTETTPKQFHALGGSLTMMQETASRVRAGGSVAYNAPYVIANERHAALIRNQLAPPLDPPEAIVLEPVGRNTAAVAAVAAELVRRRQPDALVLLMPADHVVRDVEAFEAAILSASEVARDRLVTFGIKPTEASTGYGYIQTGAALAEGVYEAARFVEKPDAVTAERYIAGGDYFWNSGIFLFSPEVMLSELRRFRPEIERLTLQALHQAKIEDDLISLDAESFAQCPSESLDYAVMEHTRLAAVVPCDIGWADIGSWSELWRLHAADDSANVLTPRVAALESEGSIVWSENIPVAVLGAKDMIVAATAEGVVVLPKSRAQDVKLLLQTLRQKSGAA